MNVPIKEGFFSFRGYRTWYRTVGDSEEPGKLPLICLHGGPGASWDYLEPLEVMAETGRRVIFYDQLGSGNSDEPRNRVIDIVEIYHGSLNSAQVRVGELFKPAIQRMSAAIILVHNHPSGDPTPSPDDVAVTRAVVQAGKLLDIDTLDHLVIGRGRFVSLKERGLGFDGRVSETIPGYRLRRSTRYSIQDDDDLIYAYTRSQALEDGVLVDVSKMAGEAGFLFPTAITADLHARITPNEREKALGQSYEGRLWDVVFLASFTARGAVQVDRCSFEVGLFEADEAPPHRTHRRTLSLWMVVGPGDRGEPVITIGFPEDF